MKIEIEIEDSIYHKMEEFLTPQGITLEQFIERALPVILSVMAVNPEEYDKMAEAFYQAGPEIAERIVHRVLRESSDTGGS